MMKVSFLLAVVSVVALSAEGSVPEGMRSFFVPGGIENANVLSTQATQDSDRLSRLQSSVEEARRSYSTGDFSRYMANPVRKAQCYVEFQVTQRQPGRCIKLGGQTPACQTSDYVSINFSECS